MTSLAYANVQPAHLLLGFIVLAAVARQGAVQLALRQLSFPNAGFWLALTAAYALLSAFLLPRLFAGATYVFAIARTEIGSGIVSMPLAPTSGNITQSVYFLGDVACFIAVSVLASAPDGFKATVQAILACAALNMVFAAVDVGAWLTHAGDQLAFIRNANYRMLDEATVAGFKRIVGSFPEASTFAYFTLGWFAFCTRLWLAGIASGISGPLAFLSLIALLFATSSTGYFGTAVFAAALLVGAGSQMARRPVSRRLFAFTLLGPVIAALVVIGLSLHQPSWGLMQAMADRTVFSKLATQSGIERAMWNEQALANFTDTYWLGAGVGSVRASSFPVAVLGNIGAVGAATYGAFLWTLLVGRKRRWVEPYPAACQSAARWACLAQIAGASVAGSFIDLGLPFFIFAGLACAGPIARRATAGATAPVRTSPAIAGAAR